MNQHTTRLSDATIDRFALMSCAPHGDDLLGLAQHCNSARIELFRPDRWLEHSGQPAISALYDRLETRLAELGLHPRLTHQFSRNTLPALTTLSAMAYHTCDARAGFWNIKVSHLPDWFTFDRTGYAGWSELAQNTALQALAQEMPSEAARDFVATLSARLQSANASKFAQAARGAIALPAMPGFLFVPLQTEDDAVMQHAPGGMPRLVDLALTAQAQLNLPLVFKRHPKCTSPHLAALMKAACARHDVHESRASIHDLIDACGAVLVQNSGTGFEAMVQGKPVYTLGLSDYAHVTRRIETPEDLAASFNASPRLTQAEQDRHARLIAFLGTRYTIRPDAPESLDRHLLRMLLTHMRLLDENTPC